MGRNDISRDEEAEELLITRSNHRHPWMVYLSTAVAVCGSYQFGACIGYSSPTQSAIRSDLGLSLAEYSVFGSIMNFGAMAGAITSGPIADFFGRKGTMRISSAFCVAGWFAVYFAQGAVALDIGRLATGYGIGIFSFVVPVFIAEISPKELRGVLTAINQLMIVIGVSMAFILGTVLSWRVLALTGTISCVVLVFGLLLIPESPRWLAKVGKDRDFEVALQKLRGEDVDTSQEAADIREYIENLERLPKARLRDLREKRYMQPLTIGVMLMIFQQFGGINGISFYVSDIFDQAGVSSTLGSISYAIIQIVVTAIGATLMDKVGRKPLLLVSACGLFLGSLLAAVSFYLKDHGGVDIAPVLAISGILIFVASFSIGMGAVPWILMSEIFPIDIKGVGGGLTTLVNWFGSWTVSYTFNFLMSWSSCGTFLLYAATNAIAVFFVIGIVPETKGKTLEQIQAAIGTKA